jgi:regulator of CtrA degradation
MPETPRGTAIEAAPVATHEALYREAMRLLIEARDYVAQELPRETGPVSARDRLAVARETSRLTTRLTEVMAWLLARRAVQAGELPAAEALRDERRLGHHRICLQADPDEALPQRLRALLEKSLNLYRRAARLDDEAGGRLN